MPPRQASSFCKMLIRQWCSLTEQCRKRKHLLASLLRLISKKNSHIYTQISVCRHIPYFWGADFTSVPPLKTSEILSKSSLHSICKTCPSWKCSILWSCYFTASNYFQIILFTCTSDKHKTTCFQTSIILCMWFRLENWPFPGTSDSTGCVTENMTDFISSKYLN